MKGWIDFKKVKEMSICDFLNRVGSKPVYNKAKSALYHAPYRKDVHPSLWVNKVRNTWYDLATGQHGDIADLGIALYHITDLHEVVKLLEKSAPFPLIQENMTKDIIRTEISNGGYEDIHVGSLGNWRLLDYLRSRCIDIHVAQKYCSEIHYMLKGRFYYAIGFPNIAGGYELRNKFFKGCISPKNISVIEGCDNKDMCYLFEGFFDFLSFVTLHLHADTVEFAQEMNYVVLNSVSNIDRAIPLLLDYNTVTCCLDNDAAGHNAMLRLSEHHENVHDASEVYAGYKDFNEFLIAERHKRKEI